MEPLQVDFVLVRGPANVSRRLRVSLPADGTPVTIGRALHCGAVLDPWLVFASQVQCSLFAVPPPTAHKSGDARKGTEAMEDNDSTTGSSTAGTPKEGVLQPARSPKPEAETSADATVTTTTTPDRGTRSSPAATPLPLPPVQLYITDLCSSNGTFVNSVRVGTTDACPLKDGDACIFGGMRDVPVGGELPADAFDGPELVVWRVDVVTGKNVSTPYAFEATPTLLPAVEVLQWENREIGSTALRSLRQPTAATTGGSISASHAVPLTGTPAAPVGPRTAEGDGPGDQSGLTPATPDIPQRLFAPGTANTPTTEARPHLCGGIAGKEGADSARRSGTVAARISAGHTLSARAASTVTNTIVSEANAVGVGGEGQVDTPPPSPRDHSMSLASVNVPNATDPDFFLLLSTLESCGAPPTSTTTTPPAPVHYHALRAGRHTYHVPIASLLGAYLGRVEEIKEGAAGRANLYVEDNAEDKEADEGEDSEEAPQATGKKATKRVRQGKVAKAAKIKRKKTAGAAAPEPAPLTAAEIAAGVKEQVARLPHPVHTIQFTDTHWKWVMDNPNTTTAAGRRLPTGLAPAPFHAMLPVTSIQTVMVCWGRLGLSVELKDGCQVPPIRHEVFDSAPENRWLVWMLEDTQRDPQGAEGQGDNSGAAAESATSGRKKRGGSRQSKRTKTETDGEQDVPSATISLHERFEEWVARLASYYGAFKVPAPIAVDADTFDKLFAPDRIVD